MRAELHNSRTRYYRLQPAYDRRLAGDDGAEVDGGALASSAKRGTTTTAATVLRDSPSGSQRTSGSRPYRRRSG